MNGRGVIMAAGALTAAATLVAGAAASSEATGAGSYRVVGKWGKTGAGNGQFGGNAFGLATDKSGRVYVADSDNRRIQIFSSRGAFQGKIAFGDSVVPDVAVDADGNVWGTTDTGAQARQFTRDGRPLGSITTPKVAAGIGADAGGNIYVTTHGDAVQLLVRYDKAGSYAQGKSWGGFQVPSDVEISSDGTVWVSDNRALNVKRFDANGKLLKTIKAGPSAPLGIGVDLDCNVWVTNIAQRRLDKLSPSGRLLGTATAPDLIAQDVAVGPTGDLYAYDSGTRSVIRFAEDRSKPATATIPGTLTAAGGVVKIAYTLSGIACPAVVGATATLTGPGIAGKAAGLKLKAGAKNTITMKLSKAASGRAAFKVVLKTNGRATTETRTVSLVSR
jgi:sugar lactone lactonase YvrE